MAAAVQAAEYHAQPAQQGSAWIYWQDVPLTGVEIYLRDFEGVYAFPSSKGTVVGANWATKPWSWLSTAPASARAGETHTGRATRRTRVARGDAG